MAKQVIVVAVLSLSAGLCLAQDRKIEVSPEATALTIAVDDLATKEIAVSSGSTQTFIVQPAPTIPPVSTGGRRGKARMIPTLPKEYEARDKNGDGQIGLYEWDRSKYAEFAKLDKNGDGFLTPQELNAKGNVIGARLRGGILEKDALPNPGNLMAQGQMVGESFVYSVTGRTTGAVYGTGTYTADSDLATVAVHAGLLKDGEKGAVTVTIVATPNEFSGTTANGITSSSWADFPAAFTVR